jgi:Endonuclease/Exonuclease/phosphatase family
VMVVHEKSRLGGRAVTDPVREGAARALVQKLDRDYEDKRFILLGDFNDNPDDKSLNILETGDIDAEGGAEQDEGAFLGNPAEQLVALDQVSHGKSAADIDPQTGRIDVTTVGSRARNNDNRGNNTNTGDILFDQILFPPNVASFYVRDRSGSSMLVVQLKERAVTTATKRPITYRYVPTLFLGARVEEVMAEERRRLLACVLLA